MLPGAACRGPLLQVCAAVDTALLAQDATPGNEYSPAEYDDETVCAGESGYGQVRPGAWRCRIVDTPAACACHQL